MKHLFKNIATASLLLTGLFSGKAFAQAPAEKDKSLLWEIRGKGLAQPSYLYGTIHMICEKDFKVTEKAARALHNSAQLVIEANVFDPEMTAILTKAMTAEVPLSKKLSPEDYHEIDSIVRKTCGMPLAPFENYRLTMLISLMAQKSFPCTELKSYEDTFVKMAQADKMKIGYFEGLEEQTGYMLKSFTDQQVIDQIKGFDSTKRGNDKMTEAYKAEDLNALYRYVTTPDLMDENSMHWMLEVRNQNWVAKMPEMMQQGSAFFAVGGAHLAGPIGLIKLLREKGYTVTPILN